jgi:hypothetical protein
MGAERQVLEFILQPSEKAFDKGIQGMEKSVERFSKAAGDAFDIADTAKATGRSVSNVISELTQERGQRVGLMTSGLAQMAEKFPIVAKGAKMLAPILGGALNLAIKGLTITVGKALDNWKNFTVEQEKYARATGMTRDETREFSAEIISASSKYGVALDKVQNMANFLGKGMKGARKEVARFAGDLSNFADLTESGEENTQQLARVMTRRMGMGFDQTEKAMFGYRAMAKEAGIETSELTQLLAENENFIRVKGKKGAELMAAQGAAMAASMREAGFDFTHTQEVMRALGDQESKLMDHFRTAGFDVTKLAFQMKGLTNTLDPNNPAAYEKAISDMEQTFGISRQAIEAMAASADDINNKMETYTDTTAQDLVKLRADLEDSAGPLKKLERSWNKVVNSMTGVLNDILFPALEFWIDKIEMIVQGVKGLLGIVDKDTTFQATTEEEKAVQKKRTQLTVANENLAKGLWDEATYRRFVEENKLQGTPGALLDYGPGGAKGQVPGSAAPGVGKQQVPAATVPPPSKDAAMDTVAAVERLLEQNKEQVDMQKRTLEIEEEKRRERRGRGGGGRAPTNPYAGAAAVAEQGG